MKAKQKIEIKDPKLTEYVLGEMSEEEQLEFESSLQNDAALKSSIEEIGLMSDILKEEFSKEELPVTHVDPGVTTELGRFSAWKKFFSVAIPLGVTAGLSFMVLLPNFQKVAAPLTAPTTALIESETAAPLVEAKIMGKGLVVQAPAVIVSKKDSKQQFQVDIRGGSPSQSIGLMEGRRASKGRLALDKNMSDVLGKRAKRRSIYVGNKMVADQYLQSPLPVRFSGERGRESYAKIVENGFKKVSVNPLSTFSIDVDTASYSNIRRFLSRHQMPPKNAVRIEEMVNYFSYGYAPPEGKRPFAVHTELVTSPWNKQHKLLKIGLKGREIAWKDRKNSNIVFLLDVSGSMRSANKLPLVKQGIKLLVDKLGKKDHVAIVVYAGASGLVLPSTSADQKEEILAAIDRLQSGGSTNGGAGIQLAYKTAQQNFIKGGINRVILATDGDFNVGTTNQQELIKLIKEKAKSNVFLTVLGFGSGNYQDDRMEAIANKGNGNYAYIDSYREAKKVLVEQAGGTLITIAKDVKIQVEFNPAKVAGYRLLGYENRMLKKEDFNNDKKDAGEIGAGHTVTALYEIVPAGIAMPSPSVDTLKYQKVKAKPTPTAVKSGGLKNASKEWLTVKLRYKEPTSKKSTKFSIALAGEAKSFPSASTDMKFAASVAAFGMLLRESQYAENIDYAAIKEMALEGKGEDGKGYRAEFIRLVERVIKLKE